MVHSIGLAVMVKTPGLSPVKTRLAQDVGELSAIRIYIGLLDGVAKLMGDVKGEVSCYWAVAESEAQTSLFWRNFPRIVQQGDSLGERLAFVEAELWKMHRGVILIGADTPALSKSDISKTLAWMIQPGKRHVLGPSRDGGFYLFAANYQLGFQAWNHVTYSTDSTLAELKALIPEDSSEFLLEERHDVDLIEDVILSISRSWL